MLIEIYLISPQEIAIIDPASPELKSE